MKVVVLMICCMGLYSLSMISCSSSTSGGGASGSAGSVAANFSGQNASSLVECDTSDDDFIPAFPSAGTSVEAEGFGACATGGRLGRVIYVTNLNSSGSGSLQAALDVDATRTIVFAVSGVIDDIPEISYGDVTIAGQTSPGGVTVKGLYCTNASDNADSIFDDCYNVIIQNIRIRPDYIEGAELDGLRLDGSQRVIIDHVSIGNATDESIQISQAANITIQNTLMAEVLGHHSLYGGILINYSTTQRPQDYISLHHNMWNRVGGRLPEISCEENNDLNGTSNCANKTLHLEVSNNIYWDPYTFVTMAGTNNNSDPESADPFYVHLNFVGNYSYMRDEFPYYGLIYLPPGAFDGTQSYFNDNRMNLYPTRTDYQLDYCCNDFNTNTSPYHSSPPSIAQSARFDYPEITYTASSALRTYMINNVGAFPRDAMDQRIMAPVIAGTISNTTRNENPADDAHDTCTNSAGNTIPADTDEDGMPNSWEITKGLDPNTQDHNGHDLNTSYTNLEIYLNELMLARLSQTCS